MDTRTTALVLAKTPARRASLPVPPPAPGRHRQPPPPVACRLRRAPSIRGVLVNLYA